MAKEVKLKLTLDETGAVVGVDKVGERFKKMKTSGQGAGMAGNAGFMKLAAGAAVAMGAIQLVQGAFRALNGFIDESISKTAQTQDEIAKLSHKVGVSTETLSAYRLATQLSGTSMESLATGLRMVAKNAYDASMGTGDAKVAFEDLGITVTDGNGKLKDSEVLLLEVADKLAGVDDSSRRTAMGMKIFGRSGTDLLPMMENGRAGIEAMKEEARALGMTFTDETAMASEQYNDSLVRMDGAFEGLKMRIGNAVIPALTQVVQAVMQNEEFMNMLSSAAEFTGKAIQRTIVIVSRALAFWIGDFAAGLMNMASLFRIWDDKLEAGAKTAKSWGQSLSDIAFKVENLSFVMPKATSSTRDFTAEMDSNAEAAGRAASAVDQWNTALLASSHHENVDVHAGTSAGPGLMDVFGNVDAVAEEARKKKEDLDGATSGLALTNFLPLPPEIMTQGENPTVRFADETIGALDLMKAAALEFGQAGGQAFSQWATGQASMGTALRQATVQVLASLGSQAFALALMETGLGIAALTPWGRAVYGDPTKHFLAAGKFGILAGVAGGLSRAMSGGEGGMGSPGSAGNPIYTQPSYQTQNQAIYSDQAQVMVEIRDVLCGLKTQKPGVLVKEGVGQVGGVINLMNDRDKNEVRRDVLQSRYA